MAFTPGTRLGPYEIVSPLGAGGMGEVYRARDTKLNRDVALKVLPELFAADPDRLARFKREAQVLAALNHPNIAAIHGLEDTDGVLALVLELVEGPTLAERVAQGAMPLDEALPIARQIADALEAAHERGIVHRDLKPANVKVRSDGTVKVLDFGLAKALEGNAGSEAQDPAYLRSQSPTLSVAATRAGVILGTAAYMAPEQARGKAVDKRADIWAFGCVLYEMLTGRRAFGGDDLTDTLAFIITREPDWSALPRETPPSIHRLLRRCLVKERKNRLPEIGTARLEIDEALSPSPDQVAVIGHAAPRGGRERLAWIAAAVTGVALLATVVTGAALYLRRPPPDISAYLSSILPPEGTFVVSSASITIAERLSVSPDGRYLAFVATAADGRQALWLRRLDGLAAQPLSGGDGASSPFWSPDSRFVAFFADGKLKRLDISGGPPVTLCDAANAVGGTWNRDDVILFAAFGGAPIQRVPAFGGTPIAATTLDTASGETAHWSPSFLPDGQHFLYGAVRGVSGSTQVRGVYVASLDSSEKTLVLEGGSSNAQYADGHLLFARDTTLMAQPFDVDALELAGNAIPIAEQLHMGGIARSRGLFSVSDTGVLVMQPSVRIIGSQLAWVDRAGKELGKLGGEAEYADVELSPDGTQAAVTVMDPARRTGDIWVYDIARGLRTRFTSDPADDLMPTWSPDGGRILFASRRKGVLDAYVKAAGGGENETALLEDGSNKFPTWSADGRFVVYARVTTGNRAVAPQATAPIDLWWFSLEPAQKQPVPFLVTPFGEGWPRFSPNGRWIAYQSDESGRSEIYVAPFPKADRKWLISTTGGLYPRWRRDGRELFYIAPGNTLMAAAVNADGSRVDVGTVRRLFDLPATPARIPGYGGWRYDVSPDGQRFLVEIPVEAATSPPMTLIVNWPALLRN